MSNKKNGAGFTLIELLVVIAIIGFLAAIVLVSTSTARGRSRDARRMGDMQALQTAVELYNQACSQYPPALTLTASAGGELQPRNLHLSERPLFHELPRYAACSFKIELINDLLC